MLNISYYTFFSLSIFFVKFIKQFYIAFLFNILYNYFIKYILPD
nr:MAG TPA: hypothetical protein [Caudoviricetes sp.]